MADQNNHALGSHEHKELGSSPASGNTSPSYAPKNGSYRFSQYAEANANPLPELAVVPEEGTELEPFPRLSDVEFDISGCSTRAVVEPDDISDHRPAAVVYAGEEPTKWRKYRTAVIIALIILILALTGTVVGVVVSNSKNTSVGASPSTSATSTSASTTMGTVSSAVSSASSTVSSVRSTVTTSVSVSSSSSTSSSSSMTSSHSVFLTPAPSYQGVIMATQPGGASVTHVPTPTQCADASGFLTSVSFMGVKGAPGNGGWKTTYCGSASNAKDCCACCSKSKDGCNAWAYYASSGFAGTRCALIIGWDTDDDKDSTCPAGHDATVYFTTDSDDSSDVGAAGPCGVNAD